MYQPMDVPLSEMVIMPLVSVGHVVDAVGRSGGVLPPLAVEPLSELLLEEPPPEPLLDPEWPPELVLEEPPPEPLPDPEPPPAPLLEELLLGAPEPLPELLPPDPRPPPALVPCDPHEATHPNADRKAIASTTRTRFGRMGLTAASRSRRRYGQCSTEQCST
jgi:hypothetical protein